MGIRMFAAIDVGSYELGMKIFEIKPHKGIRQIDDIRHSIDLGTDTYATGKISYERVDELCNLLREFRKIMDTYQVTDYQAYGTSAVRETENTMIVLDQIEQRTGIRINVLSNSEQRFLDYKSLAFRLENFERYMKEGAAVVDIGGGSIQVSLFEEGTLVTTQNLKLGVLRLQERLNHMNAKSDKVEGLIEEMVGSQLAVFQKLYLKDFVIQNIIIIDDYLTAMTQKYMVSGCSNESGTRKEFDEFIDVIRLKNLGEIAHVYDISDESASLLYISAVMMKQIIAMVDAKMICAPGVTLCDGIAYEYAQKNKMITQAHDFESDIISCAKNISKRYLGSKRRGETLEKISLTIFDSMKNSHGLGKRERLLLQISTILHDCGKYISMVNLGECSYNIVMSTEIIGLSHMEREIVANVIKYNHLPFDYYEALGKKTTLDKKAYLCIAKLTATLRLANALDRSHKQKFKDVKTVLKENQLIIMVDTTEDITLEKGMFGQSADFFEEVYSVYPVIKQKKVF